VDARSDIFSFGVVLYELLTHTHPFRRETPTATLGSILETEPKAPGELAPALPHDLEKIVLRCLRKEPDRRFQSMADLELELGEVAAVLDSPPPEPVRAARRRWLWLAAGGIVVVLIGLAAAVSTRFASNRHRRRRSSSSPPFPERSAARPSRPTASSWRSCGRAAPAGSRGVPRGRPTGDASRWMRVGRMARRSSLSWTRTGGPRGS